jgi:chloride channel protein, CIC family
VTTTERKAKAVDLSHLGDFTATPRLITISVMAVVIGVIGAYVAWALLRLIGIFTNLFFFQRWGTALVSPAGNTLGPWEILVPVVGALIIGFLARYGSERIRGHGIPEAIEAILITGVVSTHASPSSSPSRRPSQSVPVDRSALRGRSS